MEAEREARVGVYEVIREVIGISRTLNTGGIRIDEITLCRDAVGHDADAGVVVNAVVIYQAAGRDAVEIIPDNIGPGLAAAQGDAGLVGVALPRDRVAHHQYVSARADTAAEVI